MEEWFSEPKIPLGKWIKELVGFAEDHLYWFFDFISLVVGTTIEGVIDLLLFFPPLLVIALVAALAYWLHRSWKLTAGAIVFLLLIVNMGYWEETIKSLALILASTIVCMAIGVPLGIAAAHRPRLYAALRPVLDLMQTIPTFVYLIPTMVLFGLGVVPGLISTVIFALPSPIRLTHLGVSSVPKPLLEAGESFGASKSQLLWKVELPHALPTIMAGLTQCIMLSLSMVVIAALVGADGLGVPVIRALNTVNIPKGFEAGLAIVIVAILLDRLCKEPAKKTDKK
ncbi:choline ABC transporter permease subunit [Rhodovibrionaceae bacterium A322]